MRAKEFNSSPSLYLCSMLMLLHIVLSLSSARATEVLTAEEILAVEADSAYGQYLAGECLTCHTGQNTNASIPDIHGKEALYIVGALLEYKYHSRENETMRSIASAMDKDEIAAIAAYFSELN